MAATKTAMAETPTANPFDNMSTDALIQKLGLLNYSTYELAAFERAMRGWRLQEEIKRRTALRIAAHEQFSEVEMIRLSRCGIGVK
jgi:hypothetical protein